jgi:Ethanolamine utilization protein EutJ (predicted chaperonin)
MSAMSLESRYIVGIDLGGTNIVSVLLSEKGDMIARDTRPSLAKESEERVFLQIINSVRKIIGEGESKLGISSESMRKASSSCFSRERRQFRRLRGVVEGSRQGCGQSGFIHSGDRNRRRDNH